MSPSRILMGVVGRPHGVRGLVRVQSYAADPATLASCGPLLDERGRRWTLDWAGAGIARLSGEDGAILDRDAAQALVNLRLYIERERLPPPGEDEFYFADLLGLRAESEAGLALGTVAAVHEYGAGPSLEIARAEGGVLLVPFTRAAVPEVDLRGGRLVVRPPAEVAGEAAHAGRPAAGPPHAAPEMRP